MVEKKKNKNKELGSIMILSLTIMILFSTLVFLVYILVGFQTLFHEQTIEELELEKEIALISSSNNLELKYNHTFTYEILANYLLVDKYCSLFIQNGKSGYLSMGPGGNYINCHKYDNTWESGDIYEYLKYADKETKK